MVQKLMEDGHVLIAGKTAAKNARLKAGTEIVLEIPAPQEMNMDAEEIPLEIVYEDDSLLVVNKPQRDGSTSSSRELYGDTGECLIVSLQGEFVWDWRGNSSRNCPPDRQGYQRVADCG